MKNRLAKAVIAGALCLFLTALFGASYLSSLDHQPPTLTGFGTVVLIYAAVPVLVALLFYSWIGPTLEN